LFLALFGRSRPGAGHGPSLHDLRRRQKRRPSFRDAGEARVSPTPQLMVVASHDTITLTDLALAAYEQALEPKKFVFVSFPKVMKRA
jgi:hypothetical protein